MSKFESAVGFAEKIKKFPEVLQVILFGSVARGDEHRDSDIDIAVIYSDKKEKVMSEIIGFASEDIQLTHLSIKDLPKETEVTGALAGEGLILYGRPITITAKELALKPKLLISYDLSSLEYKDKMRINRAFFGGKSTSKYKEKKYETKTGGTVNEQGIEKIGKGVLLVSREKATKITGILKRFNAKWMEVSVWTY